MLCCDMLRNVLERVDSISPMLKERAVFCLVELWADSLAALLCFVLGCAALGHFLVL